MQAVELQLLLGKNGIIIEVSQGENSGGYPPGSMDNPRWMDPALDVATIGDIYIYTPVIHSSNVFGNVQVDGMFQVSIIVL